MTGSSETVADNAYEYLLWDVLTNGTEKEDRTGTGTISVFGRQIRFDLSEGFPLITTKKMSTRWMIEELLWFISGDTNEFTLSNKGVHWWKAWAREDGDLGPTYGKQLRHIETVLPVTPKIYDQAPTNTELPILSRKGSVRDFNERNTYGVGYMGDFDKDDPYYTLLVGVWRQMIRRCYDVSCRGYSGYGGVGVHVSEEWHCFATFQKDAKNLPNWELKIDYPDEYSLDKDTRLASNRYCPETVMWASENVQNANRSNTMPFVAVDSEGSSRLVSSIGRMHREEGVNVSAIHRCLNGKLKSHHGWSDFKYLEAPQGQVLRYNEVDQLKSVISSIRHNPTSRRHIISLWNPVEVDFMELPPCHGNIIQFYVEKGKLSCQIYQRSADLFLGVPVNIASYALLTHMVAQQTGLEVGEFVWTGGDCHIYSNHVEQVKEQLTRIPFEFPTLSLSKAEDVFSYTIDDVSIENYQHHPALHGKVAV